MRITQKFLWERIKWYETYYGFTDQTGWAQIVKDLKPPKGNGPHPVPRAVAYGAYSELLTLARM
jgi:hypothetical protein